MTVIHSLIDLHGTVTVTVRLSLRKGAPDTAAQLAGKAEVGDKLVVKGVVRGEDIKGNADWYLGENDIYFWSGGTGLFLSDQDNNVLNPLQVLRRPNGTISPLKEQQIRAIYGDFTFKEGNSGRIEIDNDWVKSNIIDISPSVLSKIGVKSIQVHKKAKDAFERVFNKIEEKGLQNYIITFGGTFVPRHKGWNPSRTLSSHSWGIAIDLNVQWNPYGQVPAALGAYGSVRELVQVFADEGFAWGGLFEPLSVCDGMHFELARLDL